MRIGPDLVTARLRLRPLVSADAEAVRRLWIERDPRVTAARRIDEDGRPTVGDLAQSLAEQHAEADAAGLGLMAVECRDSAEFVGYCGLIVGGASAAEPEIAFELCSHAHGVGYATEAARTVTTAAQSAGLPRLWASVREWNAPSFRVLEKVGFSDSGLRDPDPVHGDTVWMRKHLRP